MDKTIKDILSDHLALCVLAYARLTTCGNESAHRGKNQDYLMAQATQAASLFTVASMTALGDPGHNARVLDLVREMFRELDATPRVREACLSSLEVLEGSLTSSKAVPKGGRFFQNDEPPPEAGRPGATAPHQRPGKTPPSR